MKERFLFTQEIQEVLQNNKKNTAEIRYWKAEFVWLDDVHFLRKMNSMCLHTRFTYTGMCIHFRNLYSKILIILASG